MTDVTFLYGRDMRGTFAAGHDTVMTAAASAGNLGVINRHAMKAAGLVTVFTNIGRGNVSLGFALSMDVVMTT